jgi:hypothetical protein
VWDFKASLLAARKSARTSQVRSLLKFPRGICSEIPAWPCRCTSVGLTMIGGIAAMKGSCSTGGSTNGLSATGASHRAAAGDEHHLIMRELRCESPVEQYYTVRAVRVYPLTDLPSRALAARAIISPVLRPKAWKSTGAGGAVRSNESASSPSLSCAVGFFGVSIGQTLPVKQRRSIGSRK